jgi:hypothetical protein
MSLIWHFVNLTNGKTERQIAEEMMTAGTVRQNQRMAEALRTKITDGQWAQILVSLLWSISAAVRRRSLKSKGRADGIG